MATIDVKGNVVGTGSIVPTSNLAPQTPAAPVTPAQPTPVSVPTGGGTANPVNAGKPGFDVFGNYVGIDAQTAHPQDNIPTGQTSSTSTTTAGNNALANGVSNGPTGTSTNTTGLPSTGNATTDALIQQRQQESDALLAQAKNVSDTITQIQNGVIPLSAGDNAQVEGLKQQFQQLIDQQTLQNTGATGTAQMRGYQSGAAEYDPTFQVKTIGAVVTAGVNKITDLQIKEASAVASLTQALKDNNIKAVQQAWTDYSSAAEAHQTALKDTIDQAQKAIKDAQDAKIAADKVQYDTVTKPIQDLAATVLKNTGNKTLAEQVGNATSVEQAISIAGDSLQTATGDLGDYLDYKRQAQASGKTPTSYDDFLKAKKAADLAQKSSEAYATAYASAKGKAAGENAAGVSSLKPLTQQQATDFTYAQRGDMATPIIDKAQGTVAGMDATTYVAAKTAYGSDFLNQFVPNDLKSVFQAEKNFASAILRRESGAAISQGEYDTVDSTYFPRPGDDAATLAQKAQLRQTAIDSIRSNVPDYANRVAQTTPGGILNTAEDLSQASVIDYGSKNPTAQASIKQMVADGKSYTDIKQLLGI